MALVIDLAARNVAHEGGPFGAAVFEATTGALIAVGANWVLAQRSSLLHAEVRSTTSETGGSAEHRELTRVRSRRAPDGSLRSAARHAEPV
jgi:tRNA(Arg) A34 adenosine deaminase TadA